MKENSEERVLPNVDRRQFVRAVGAAGVAGGVAGALSGIGPLVGQAAAQPLRASQRPPAADEFPKPAGLRQGAQLDSRYPVSFAAPVSEGLRLLMEYFIALSQRDVQGIARTLHFPFAIYEDIEPIVVQTAADMVANPPPTLNGTANGQSRILRGSYDLLESLNVHLYCPVGAAFSLSFTRYTPDGHKLLACDGIYSVTNNDGRWAIQLASTIFHEVDFIGVTYSDAEAATTRAEQNYLSQFGYGNEAVLNDPKSSRGSYEPPLPAGTRTASVNFGYGPRERSRDAREGHPMAGWRTRGVKSRLSVAVRSDEALNRTLETNLPEFIDLAGGAVGKYAYTRDRPVRPITIHATHDKAHTLGGYFRYTADGTLISETRSVSIRIYKNGHWGSAGSLGQVTHHDRSNSKA
jgi:hypothetical protein